MQSQDLNEVRSRIAQFSQLAEEDIAMEAVCVMQESKRLANHTFETHVNSSVYAWEAPKKGLSKRGRAVLDTKNHVIFYDLLRHWSILRADVKVFEATCLG